MVMISGQSGARTLRATTDSNGRAIVTGVPDGKATLTLLWAAGQHATRELEIDGDQEVIVELDRETYFGRVVDANSGAGIADVTLSVLQGDDAQMRSLGSTRSGGDGTFELLVEASGPVSIAAQAVGYMPYRGTHALVLGSDLAIALEPATALRLLVSPAMLSRDLPPRVLARAGAQVVTEEPQLQPGTLPGTSLLELNQLGAGSWRVLLISSEGHARLDLTLPLADGIDAIPVALQPNGALEFQLADTTSNPDAARIAIVLEPGVPIEQGFPLGIVDLSANVPPGGGFSRIFGGRLANGAFRMENLPAGNLLLQIRGENGQSVVLEVPFSVAPGATTELSLP
jgi:hypothetical protein